MAEEKKKRFEKKFLIVAGLFLAFVFVASLAFVSATTESGSRISTGSTQFTSSSGACIVIDNGCGSELFVGSSSAEQDSFVNGVPSCVSVTSCTGGSAPSTATTSTISFPTTGGIDPAVVQAVIASLDATAAAGGTMMSSTSTIQTEAAPLGIVDGNGNTYTAGSSSSSTSTTSSTSSTGGEF